MREREDGARVTTLLLIIILVRDHATRRDQYAFAIDREEMRSLARSMYVGHYVIIIFSSTALILTLNGWLTQRHGNYSARFTSSLAALPCKRLEFN